MPASGYATSFWGPPDLAVETTSPGDRVSEIQEKVTGYLDAGVPAVRVIDPPTCSVTAYAAGGGARIRRSDEVLEGDPVLPGFRLPLAAFFAL